MDWNTVWTAVGATATVVGALAIGFAALQLRFEAWLKAQEVFVEKGFVEARTALFKHFDHVKEPWPANDDKDAKEVCRRMDQLAGLESFVTLSRERTLEVWGNPIAKAWLLLEPMVKAERRLTHWDNKWEAFAVLGREAVRCNQGLAQVRKETLAKGEAAGSAAQQGDATDGTSRCG